MAKAKVVVLIDESAAGIELAINKYLSEGYWVHSFSVQVLGSSKQYTALMELDYIWYKKED